MGDNVKHPSHYADNYPVEVIDIIRELLGEDGFKAYCFGNEIKYRMRAGLKGDNAEEDIAKAMQYMEFRLHSKGTKGCVTFDSCKNCKHECCDDDDFFRYCADCSQRSFLGIDNWEPCEE